ncbi:NHL repeat protein [bacterium BMS3Bbin04]|nr:NHL repeat protein [bacterium BMS3Bbin04]
MPQALIILVSLMFVQLGMGLPLFKKDKADRYEEDHTTWVYPPWEHTWGVVLARQIHLDIFTFGRVHFDNPQGMAVVRLEATDDPEKKGDDDEVTVYGINTGENGIIYNKSMHSIGLYGYSDEGPGSLKEPWDVAALPNGLVFVTDSGHRRVVKLRNIDGDLIYEGEFGNHGDETLVLPRGIAVTAGGYVLVADAGSDRVVVYDTSGVFSHTIEGFDRPVGLAAVDSLDNYTNPRLNYFAVTDSGGQRLRRVGYDGTILNEVDISRMEGTGGTYAGHVEIDLYHNVIVTDSTNNRILKFNKDLEFLSAWGQGGKGRTRFDGPTGIAIWRRFGQTFIAHAGGAHYVWVGVDLTVPPRLQVSEPGRIRVGLTLTERAQVDLELVDGEGEVVRDHTRILDGGEQSIIWRYDNVHFVRAAGRFEPEVERPGVLPPGEYMLRIRLRATYSSRKAFEKVMETSVILPEI